VLTKKAFMRAFILYSDVCVTGRSRSPGIPSRHSMILAHTGVSRPRERPGSCKNRNSDIRCGSARTPLTASWCAARVKGALLSANIFSADVMDR
jgi:hypothetical protein